MIEESDFDNLLVGQKDYILNLANNGRMVEAKAALCVVYKMWRAAGYDYKAQEIWTKWLNETGPFKA